MQAYPGQVQVQVVSPAAGGNQGSKYSKKLKILGILQIVLSVVSVLSGMTDCLTWSFCTYAASAIWGGILFFLPAGILALLTVILSLSARKGLAIAGLVMSILAAVVAVVSLGLYADAFFVSLNLLGYAGAAAADGIASLVSVAELIIAIITAVYCGLVLNEQGQDTGISTPAYTNRGAPNAPTPTYTPHNN